MNRNKVLGLLGLAEKAGKVRSGEFSTEKAARLKRQDENRPLHREGGKVRKSRTGDRIGRIFGQHKENVPEHVYLL